MKAVLEILEDEGMHLITHWSNTYLTSTRSDGYGAVYGTVL